MCKHRRVGHTMCNEVEAEFPLVATTAYLLPLFRSRRASSKRLLDPRMLCMYMSASTETTRHAARVPARMATPRIIVPRCAARRMVPLPRLETCRRVLVSVSDKCGLADCACDMRRLLPGAAGGMCVCVCARVCAQECVCAERKSEMDYSKIRSVQKSNGQASTQHQRMQANVNVSNATKLLKVASSNIFRAATWVAIEGWSAQATTSHI